MYYKIANSSAIILFHKINDLLVNTVLLIVPLGLLSAWVAQTSNRELFIQVMGMFELGDWGLWVSGQAQASELLGVFRHSIASFHNLWPEPYKANSFQLDLQCH